jgi:hypothetical protein
MPSEIDYQEVRAVNREAYRRLKSSIDKSYPAGRFVAIVAGEIAGDAARFEDLDRLLDSLGLAPEEAFVVQAGVDHPESGIILLSGIPHQALAREC